jgi:carbon-monoxide dehydrogenase medium subunit
MYTMRPAQFEYHRPSSIEEAVDLLTSLGDAKPLAGGHSLLPLMKLRLTTPAALVDLSGIPGLGEISGNGGLTIGALATHVDVAGSEVAIGIAPVIPETARMIGDRQVRNRGTIGGSVAPTQPRITRRC